MGHHHGHDHGVSSERALLVAVALNAAFLCVEAGVGWWVDSLALLSDAGHMVSDVGSLLVAYFAARIRHRTPSPEYTFGLRRAPVLGALINGVLLVGIVTVVVVEALRRLGAPPAVPAGPVLVTGVLGLGINVASAWYLTRTSDHSVNIRGAILHLAADALGSVAAIVSALAIALGGLAIADPIASLVIAVLILLGTLPLLRDTLRILLQRAPAHIEVEDVRQMLIDMPLVEDVHGLHIWEVDTGDVVITGHVLCCVDELEKANHLADAARRSLQAEFGIDHVTLEFRHQAAEDCCPASDASLLEASGLR
jgi:cobalt-zinc-cadmium efflux system protein